VNKKKNIAALFLIPVLMFGFGYLMVPIYNVFCDLTGLNGKTGTIGTAEASRLETDQSRMIKVEFMATLNQNVPLDFGPEVKSMIVYPGKSYKTMFSAHNELDKAIVGQAIPSVSPARAASYFNKTECFCFTQQKFAAGERRDMPLVFVVDPDLPKNIETVTLSYTFFDVTDTVATQANRADIVVQN
jgi:cytochrome c oxidase assembly protein subunit 11